MENLKEFVLEDGSKIKTMNLDNYYIHATGGYHGFKNSACKIIDILKEGKIRANNKAKYSHSPKDKVCLCDTTKPLIHSSNGSLLLSSFEDFVLYSPSLVFNRNIDVIIPKYDFIHNASVFNNKDEFADCYDEVRHLGDLTLEELEFITFPFYWFAKNNSDVDLDYRVKQLEIFRNNIEIIQREFKMIPIKEIYTGYDIKLDDVDRQIEVYQKKLK